MNKTIITGLVAGTLAFGAGTIVSPSTETFDTKNQEVKIQVLIKEPNFQDAIYYTPTEWETLTAEDIDKVKIERFTNWQKIITEQSTKITPEPTIEQLKADKLQLEQQLEIINSKLNAKIY